MIYTHTGKRGNELVPQNNKEPDFEFLIQYQPQRCLSDKASELSDFKDSNASYFIAGTLKKLKRNNDNLVTRSLVPIDYENTGLSYDQLVKKVETALAGYRYLIYPTINDGVKDAERGARARVIVDLSGEIHERDYKPVKKAITDLIGIPVTDSTNDTWSQQYGFPVKTKVNKQHKIIHHNTGSRFDVSPYLAVSNDVQNHLNEYIVGASELDELENHRAQLDVKSALRLIESYAQTHVDFLQDEPNFTKVLLFLIASYQANEITFPVVESAMDLLAVGAPDTGTKRQWSEDNRRKLQAHLGRKYTNPCSFLDFFKGTYSDIAVIEPGAVSKAWVVNQLLVEKTALLKRINEVLDQEGRHREVIKLQPYQVAQLLARYLPMAIVERSEHPAIYVYNFKAGIYSSSGYELNQWIRLLEPRLKMVDYREVNFQLGSLLPLFEPSNNENLIICNNGIFNLNDNKLHPFSPSYFLTTKIATNYVEDVPEPNINGWKPSQWISDLADGDKEVGKLLWQVIAAAVNGNHSRGKAVFLVGNQEAKLANGSNGKGTFQELLRAIVGKDNTTNIRVNEFQERFATSRLVGKSLVIGDDVSPGTYISDSGNFNSAVTGDWLPVEAKGKDAHEYLFSGLILQSMNSLPNFRNSTLGTYRRIVIVPFNAQFQGEGENQAIKNDYIHRKEVREYFVSRAVQIKFDKYDIPAASKQMMEDYQLENDTVKTFLYDFLIESPQARLATSTLYKYYTTWCQLNGYSKPVAQPTLTKEIKQILNTHAGEVTKISVQQWNEIAKTDDAESLIAKYTPLDRIQFQFKMTRFKPQYSLWTDISHVMQYDVESVERGRGFTFPLREKIIDAHLVSRNLSNDGELKHTQELKLQRMIQEFVE
ncbi:DNA primase family protein [Secundilactobacillus yichangensis]|uniref:DNA primase family protein n=1 Tax=Secundilactobacillus yichangensis TaxID=2799580 RepID=UPI0019445043|nr:DNA primase family protein [Secundilactobacillus yichangensis]